MNLFQKKLTALAVAASLVTASTLAPRRAEAGAGLLIFGLGGSALVGTGFLLASVGGMISTANLYLQGRNSGGLKAIGSYFLAAMTAMGAVYILEDSEAQSGDFKSVTNEQAIALGLSSAEYEAYESELPLINSVREEIVVRTNAAFRDVQVASAADLAKVSSFMRSNWQDLSRSALSAEATEAVEKMSAFMSQK